MGYEPAQEETAGAVREPRPVDLGPRAVTHPYKRIERPAPTPTDGPDPYGDEGPEWLRIDWREHLRTIELTGAVVNYAEIGDGPPIVFVHGLGGCWQTWLANLPHFAAAGYRAIALDLPGFGQSAMPEWEIGVPTYGRLVDEFCLALNLHSAALVGNSMGGFIAAEVAIGEPEWIDHLVLVSAAGISAAALARRPMLTWARMMNLLSPLALKLNRAGLRRPGLRQLAFQGVVRHPQRIRRELLHELSEPAVGAPAFTAAAASLAGYDLLDRLGRISVPTLLVWGRDDRVVPASDAPGYEQRIESAELHVFDQCGHLPMVERPLRFNRLVQGFIER